MHTEWSDGSGTVQSMAEAAVVRGYEYIAITDHGKRLKIAGGINEQELAEQGREIEQVNREMAGFHVLRSIELNLDTEGRGDMAPEALVKVTAPVVLAIVIVPTDEETPAAVTLTTSIA